MLGGLSEEATVVIMSDKFLPNCDDEPVPTGIIMSDALLLNCDAEPVLPLYPSSFS